MNKEKIFKNIQNIKPYKFDISDSFDLYFGQSKNNKNNCRIDVKGFAYYNCENPKAKSDCYRYYLELEINNSNKTLVVLMLNPSNTFPEMNGKKSTVDGTVKNAIRIAYKAGYSKVIILNSFNYIDGNSLTAIKSASQTSNDINAKIISNVLTEHKDLMIAWGTKVRQKDKNIILSSIWDKITDLKIYAYAWNENSNCPYHPATRVNKKNNYPLTKFLTGKTNLQELAVIKQKDKFELIIKNKY
ncbi:DUF1643 domain-containing protein [bacterium]|nr:DUF1643 domain-containing protein [bacterium]